MNDLFKPLNNLAAYEDRELLEDIHKMLTKLLETKTKATGGAGKRRHEYPADSPDLFVRDVLQKLPPNLFANDSCYQTFRKALQEYCDE